MKLATQRIKGHEKNHEKPVIKPYEPFTEKRFNTATNAGVPLFLKSVSTSFSNHHIQKTPDIKKEIKDTQIFPKLTVGAADNEYEQEADQVADIVMRMPGRVSSPVGTGKEEHLDSLQIEHSCVDGSKTCFDRLPDIQMRPKQAVSPLFKVNSDVLPSGAGAPMPQCIRSKIERILGTDLSQVRVHSDKKANTAARAIQAQAFTHRNNIYLGKGQCSSNVRLMAHESTHVVQQSSADIHRYAPEDVLNSSITEGFAQSLSDDDLRLAYGLTVSASASSSADSPEHDALTGNRTILAAEGAARGIDFSEHSELSENIMDTQDSIPIIYEAEEITPFDMGTDLGTAGSTGGAPDVPNLILPSTPDIISEDDPGSYDMFGASTFGTSTGMSSHMLAMGEHVSMGTDGRATTMFGNQTGRGAFRPTLRGMTSRSYWGSFLPRPGTIELDRIVSQVPRDLDPYYSTVRRGLPSPGSGLDIRSVANVTDDQLATIPRLIRQYNAGTISAAERSLLIELARYHANGTPRSSPLVSYMIPNSPAPSVGERLFRVRIRVPANQALNHLFENAEEFEFLLSMDHEGRVTQVSSGSQPMNSPTASRTTQFLSRHGNKVRWAGRIAIVASVGYGGYRVATASENQRGRVAGEELGGLAFGAAGTALAGAGCIALGIATGGLALFACGLVGGVAAGALGRYAGGEIGETLQHNAMAPARWVVDNAVSAWTDPMIESGDPVRRADGIAIRRVVYQDDSMSFIYLMNRMCGGCLSMR